MRDVVRRVSESQAARAADIELQPLLWEDLPPGPAEPGDLQSRVNALLDRYGLKRYEVYAGMMKDRLGTPTARFRSGTIEELETAIAGHRRVQVPAEVLFYFIESQAPEVVTFREELSGRGFLHAVVPDRAGLEQRFTEHLTRIVTEWRLWRNRLRRTFRSARSAAAIAAAMLLLVALVAYLRFDLGGARRVNDILRSDGAGAALAAYARESPYLLAHKVQTRNRLRDAIFTAIRKGTLEDATAAPVAALWQRAHGAGLWSDGDGDARRLLRAIAARRLLEALIADGIDVAEWPQHCRPFELKALRAFADETVRSPALASWPREQRAAICVLAEDWPRLGQFGAHVTLVRLAPPDVASRWIREHVTRAMPDHEVHDIVLAAEERDDRQILGAFIERMNAGAIDPAVHRDDLMRALGTDEESASLGALSREQLLRRYDEYASGRTSFGFAEKAALIEALTAAGLRDAADRALVLAKIAQRERTEIRDLNDWNVQAAYLRALAARIAAWPRHESYVRELFARRVTYESLVPDDMEEAAIDLLEKLTAEQILGLLALPPGIVSDELEGKWEPRWYALRALGQSKTIAGDAVANEVFVRLPVNAELRMRVVRAMSRSGGNVARTFLAREYVRDPKENPDYADILGDLNAEAFFQQQVAAGNAGILEAAGRMSDDAARCRVFAQAAQRFAASPILWTDAARCRIVNDALIAAAEKELRNGAHPADVAAMRYLVAIEREQPVVADVMKLLRASEPFEWVSLAQELPSRAAKEASVETLLGARALLIVDDHAAPDMFRARGKGVWNPLLARYAARNDARAARKLLEWGNGARKVEVLVRADDPVVLYRAYCLWLAAPAARHVPLSDLGVIPLLSENDPPLVRAAAAVCLGATE